MTSIATKQNPKPTKVGKNDKPAPESKPAKPETKAAFIRKFSADTPAKVISEKAAAAGMDISVHHVYSTRRGTSAGKSGKLTHRNAVFFSLLAGKTAARRETMKDWVHDDDGHVDAALGALDEAETKLREAAECLNKLPEGYSHRPAKHAVSQSLVNGEHVAVRDKFRADYDGILDPDEMNDLVVQVSTGRKVRVKPAKGGDALVMPRRELEKLSSAAA